MPGIAKKSIPFDAWPEVNQRQWQNSATVKMWPLGHRQRIARAYGRWLKMQGPGACNEATVGAFEAALGEQVRDASIVSYLVDLYYALVVLQPGSDWTWLRRRNHDLRSRVVPKQQRKKQAGARRARFSVSFEDWPPEARRRWQAALAGSDRLASLKERIGNSRRRRRRRAETAAMSGVGQEQPTEKGVGQKRRGAGRKPPGSWSEAYKSRIQRGFGMWLGWRKAQGFADAQPDPDRVSDYVAHLESPERGCAPFTVASYVEELFVASALLWPEADWDWLGYDVELLKSQAEPRRDKAAQVIPIDELYAFAFRLMNEAARGAATLHNAIQFRDGYFIALAALRPKRVSNLVSIVLGESLTLDPQGRPLLLVFRKTKNGDPSTPPFPQDRLGDYHDLWMERFRPILLGRRQDEGHLWLSREGEPLTSNAIWRQLRVRTAREFPGKSIGPHMIRTCYATSFAEEDGSLLGLVSTSLDQRDSRSLDNYRMIAGSVAAAKGLDQALCKQRESGMDALRRRSRHRSRQGSGWKRPGAQREPESRN